MDVQCPYRRMIFLMRNENRIFNVTTDSNNQDIEYFIIFKTTSEIKIDVLSNYNAEIKYPGTPRQSKNVQT